MTPLTRQMLTHALTAIRAEVGLPDAQVHFLTGIDSDVLPDVVVFGLEDKPADPGSDSAGGQVRAFQFGVTISVTSAQEADTDDLAVLVRKALVQDESLGGVATDLNWDSQEWGEGAGSRPTVITKLMFTASYRWEIEW